MTDRPFWPTTNDRLWHGPPGTACQSALIWVKRCLPQKGEYGLWPWTGRHIGFNGAEPRPPQIIGWTKRWLSTTHANCTVPEH